jgi:hypothetical protein
VVDAPEDAYARALRALPATCPAGDLYVELSRRGGYMAEAHVVKTVMQPFLSALAYMHSQVRDRDEGVPSFFGRVGWWVAFLFLTTMTK